MKKVIGLLIVLLISVFIVQSINIPSYAYSYIGVGEKNEDIEQTIYYSLGDLFIDYEDEVYISITDLFELDGFYTTHFDSNGVILLQKGEKSFVFLRGFNHYYNDDDKLLLEKNVIGDGDRYYACAKEILPNIDLSFNIDLDSRTVIISDEILERFAGRINKLNITENEFRNLSKLLFFEARDGSIIKKIAVGNVVMNRVNSPDFSNTINDVIFAPMQFPPAYYSSFATLIPPADCVEAAIRVLNGEVVAKDCLFFNMVPFPNKEDDFYKNIEGDYFYY